MGSRDLSSHQIRPQLLVTPRFDRGKSFVARRLRNDGLNCGCSLKSVTMDQPYETVTPR